MTAASFWSLLDPAFKVAREQTYIHIYVNFFLIIFGFLLGALFVYMADLLLPSITSNQVFQFIAPKKKDDEKGSNATGNLTTFNINSVVRSRLKRIQDGKNPNNRLHIPMGDSPMEENKPINTHNDERTRWHRLVLLIVAITVHNFPGKRRRTLRIVIRSRSQRGWPWVLDSVLLLHRAMTQPPSITRGTRSSDG